MCSWVEWLTMMLSSISSSVPQESGVNKVPRFRSMGVAQQMPDGTFDFVAQHRLRTQSELIKKLAHGRFEQDQGWGYSAHAEGVLP